MFPTSGVGPTDEPERATLAHGAAPGSATVVPRAATRLAALGIPTDDGLGLEAACEAGGDRLGDFPITGKLGVGGMGEILEVLDVGLGRRVAAKVALRQADPAALTKFVREAQVTGQLDHPAIPAVHALGVTDEGRVYFTMKPVRGRDLAAILDEERAAFARTGKGARRWPELLRVFIDVTDAVGYAHAKGLVHRDLKPANLMVGAFGEVYVMDWGLARVVGEGDSSTEGLRLGAGAIAQASARRAGGPVDATQEGAILGTPAYMPPEQARGEVARLDHRSDLYALGAILYEMLSLAPPFAGTSALSILAQVADDTPLPPSVRAPRRSIPWELEAIAAKAMARRPEDRYADAAAMKADVTRYLDGRRVAAARYGLAGLAWKWLARHPQLSSGVALAIAVAVTVSTVATWRERVRRDELLRGAMAAGQGVRADEAFALLAQARAVTPASSEIAAAVRAVTIELLRARLDGIPKPDDLRRRWDEADARDVGDADAPGSVTGDEAAARTARTATLDGYLAAVGWLDRAVALAPDDGAIRELRARAGEGLGWAALAGADYALARHAFTAAVAFGDPARGAELAAAVRRDEERRLVRWERRVAAVLADMAGGLMRDGRPAGAPLWDDYLIELAAYRHPRVVALLARRLAERLAEHDGGATWTAARRDEARLVCHALGRLGLVESVAPLAAALERLSDPALVAEAGIALCNTRRVEANAALFAARDRFGSNSEAWRQIARAFARIPPAGVDAGRDRDPAAWIAKGYELLGKHDGVGAAAAFERVLALDGDVAGALGGRGQARILTGDIGGALVDLDRAIALAPDRHELHGNRGFALYLLRRHEEARVALDRAIELHPAITTAYGIRSAVRLALGDAVGALADLDRAIELDPRSARFHNGRGTLRHDRGDVAGALADFDRAIELDSRSAETWSNRGKVRAIAGDTAGALADHDRAIELDPRRATCFVNRGLARAKSGDAAGALADYDHALTLDGRDINGLYHRGQARLSLGDREGALADADRAVGLAPDAPSAWSFRGHVRLACRDVVGARVDYDAAIRLGSRDSNTFYQRAGLRRALGDAAGAVADLDRAIELDPGHADASFDRAGTRIIAGELDGALSDVERGLAANPRAAHGYYNRGRIHELRGQAALALADYDRAIAQSAGMWIAWFSRGQVLGGLTRREEGLASLRRAFELAPQGMHSAIDVAIRELEAGPKRR